MRNKKPCEGSKTFRQGLSYQIGLLAATGPLLADLPGGDNLYSALITVNDQNGSRLPGVSVQLWVQTWYGEGEVHNCWKSGVTGSTGTVYLECLIPAELSEGLVFMEASMTDSRYTVISSQNTWSNYQTHIYPVFDVGLDYNDNEIVDIWEMPLAQKFCPYLILHSGDNGVRPVPVESMDRNGDGELGWEDVLVMLFDIAGGYHGEFKMDEIAIGEVNHYLMYHKYPHLAPVHKEPAIPDINGNGIFGETGEAQGIYLMLPHFEWGNIGQTNSSSWYASWNSFIQAHSSQSEYNDGTTYANFFRNGNETVIQYWFFYPFNHAANRHEGDWEHINVVLNSQNPNTANITRVEYYFHENVALRYTAGVDYFIVSGTHPKVYVGGYTSFAGYSGNGTHGSYPFSGVWPDINPIGTDETVDGAGIHINFANYQNIVILPALESVEIGDPLDWMTYGSFWGHVKSSPSAGENWDVYAFASGVVTKIPWGQPWLTILGSILSAIFEAGHEIGEDTSKAALGPATKDSWEKVYNQSGASIYTER